MPEDLLGGQQAIPEPGEHPPESERLAFAKAIGREKRSQNNKKNKGILRFRSESGLARGVQDQGIVDAFR